MAKSKNTKLTLEQIIARKKQGDYDKFSVKNYYSNTLETNIEIRKIPLVKYMEFCNVEESESDDPVVSLRHMNELAYNSCPLFRENAQEAMEVYGVEEPLDLPSAILEDNVKELQEIVAIIHSMYGVDVDETIKN